MAARKRAARKRSRPGAQWEKTSGGRQTLKQVLGRKPTKRDVRENTRNLADPMNRGSLSRSQRKRVATFERRSAGAKRAAQVRARGRVGTMPPWMNPFGNRAPAGTGGSRSG